MKNGISKEALIKSVTVDGERFFRQDKVWKMAEYFAYPQRACPHPYGSFVANGCDIFPIFRTVGLAEKIRRPRSGFIQRFLKSVTLD